MRLEHLVPVEQLVFLVLMDAQEQPGNRANKVDKVQLGFRDRLEELAHLDQEANLAVLVNR